MADLPETPGWEAGIRQLEQDDMAEGGLGGVANEQARQLANRTLFLREGQEQIENQVSSLSSDFNGFHNKYSNSNPPSISFVFDDGLTSAYDVVAPYFESKGLACGFAVYGAGIGGVNNMTAFQITDLARRGHEIINHSYSSSAFSNNYTGDIIRAEISTTQSMLLDMGVFPQIFQTPSSVLPTNGLKPVRSLFNYAFTATPSATPMVGVDPWSLWRYGLEVGGSALISLSEAKTAIDNAISVSGVVVFYAHEVSLGSDKLNLINDIISYALSKGVQIVSPSVAASFASISPPLPVKRLIKGTTIFNSTSGWFASNGATVTVDASGDIRITATDITIAAGGYVEVSQSIPLKTYSGPGLAGDTVTFSTVYRALQGTLSTPNIQLILKNSSGAILHQQVLDISSGFDNTNRRYSLTDVLSSSVALLEMRYGVHFSAIGNIALIRVPVLRYGTSVYPDTYTKTLEVQPFTTKVIPAQTIAANGTYNLVALNDMPDNGLFAVSENQIRPTRACRITISACLFSNNAAIASATGGMLQVLVGPLVVHKAPITTGSGLIGGVVSTTLDLTGASNITIRLLHNGAPFNSHGSLSTFIIQELPYK